MSTSFQHLLGSNIYYDASDIHAFSVSDIHVSLHLIFMLSVYLTFISSFEYPVSKVDLGLEDPGLSSGSWGSRQTVLGLGDLQRHT
jgi:hypothetical protein